MRRSTPLCDVEHKTQKRLKTSSHKSRRRWSITPNETALLLVLQHRLLAHFLVIPPPTSSSTASGLCVLFFVEAGSAALGKRKKAEGGS